MKGHALNAENDIFLLNNSFHFVEDGAETVQHVRSRLLFYLEEWFLDKTVGTPWLQEILIKPANLAYTESIIKQRILQTPGVLSLEEFSFERLGTDRKLTVNFTATTEYGVLDREVVTVNLAA